MHFLCSQNIDTISGKLRSEITNQFIKAEQKAEKIVQNYSNDIQRSWLTDDTEYRNLCTVNEINTKGHKSSQFRSCYKAARVTDNQCWNNFVGSFKT
jgi:hypothetical protein